MEYLLWAVLIIWFFQGVENSSIYGEPDVRISKLVRKCITAVQLMSLGLLLTALFARILLM